MDEKGDSVGERGIGASAKALFLDIVHIRTLPSWQGTRDGWNASTPWGIPYRGARRIV